MYDDVAGARRRTDLRRADVEEAERLLATADRAGLAPLPSLLVVDLCLFGAHRQSMFDESALDTWAALTGPAREQFGGEALEELIRRGLLSREPSRKYGPEPATRYRMHAALAMILGARARPMWLAVCSVASTALTGPRVYGLGNTDEPLRAAVLELPRVPPPTEPTAPSVADLGRIYDYALASTGKAADLLAEWAMLTSSDRSPVEQKPHGAVEQGRDHRVEQGRDGVVEQSRHRTVEQSHDRGVEQKRQIDIYHHPEGRPLTRVRVSVQGDERRARVWVGEHGAELASGDYDRKALADHLDDVIRRFS